MIIDNYAGDSVVQTISDTIYISNLSKDVTEEKLAEKFGSLGMLKIDRKTQKPKSKLIKKTSIFEPITNHVNICLFQYGYIMIK